MCVCVCLARVKTQTHPVEGSFWKKRPTPRLSCSSKIQQESRWACGTHTGIDCAAGAASSRDSPARTRPSRSRSQHPSLLARLTMARSSCEWERVRARVRLRTCTPQEQTPPHHHEPIVCGEAAHCSHDPTTPTTSSARSLAKQCKVSRPAVPSSHSLAASFGAISRRSCAILFAALSIADFCVTSGPEVPLRVQSLQCAAKGARRQLEWRRSPPRTRKQMASPRAPHALLWRRRLSRSCSSLCVPSRPPHARQLSKACRQ